MNYKIIFALLYFVGLTLAFVLSGCENRISLNQHAVGQPIDSLNGVFVFYNGKTSNVKGRNLSKDGYNFGLKYQCVEFVKRYYYMHYSHKMPDSYGHAKDFFDMNLKDGQINTRRNLIQYTNPSKTKPKVGDLLVFNKTVFNPYGHVAITAEVNSDHIELIQQNPGRFGKSRESISLINKDNKWEIENSRILGWLRKSD